MTYKIHMNSEANAVEASEVKFSETLRGAKQIAGKAVNSWAMEAIIFESIGVDENGQTGYDRIETVK